LPEVVRQRDPDERHALAELHARQPDAWISLKQRRGELVVHHGGPQAAQEAAMAAWRADVDQVGIEQATGRVAGEAAADRAGRAQRQQLALDLDRMPSVLEPVPDVLRAVHGLEPLWAERTLGADHVDRAAIERARQALATVPRERLEERADQLDARLATFPHNQVVATRREQRLAAVRDELGEAHERIGEQRARLDRLGPLSRLFGRAVHDDAERALANWANRAETLDREAWGLERDVYVDRHEREQWFDRHGDELMEVAAAKLELHRRDGQARERRISDIRRDPPDWVTERLGPRPDDPAARPQWDRAAAHLDDYREAFGHLPAERAPELHDYRQRHAWEQVHDAAAKALELHPERPTVQRPPPRIHRDTGLDLGR
jgi:hypothetical protein